MYICLDLEISEWERNISYLVNSRNFILDYYFELWLQPWLWITTLTLDNHFDLGLSLWPWITTFTLDNHFELGFHFDLGLTLWPTTLTLDYYFDLRLWPWMTTFTLDYNYYVVWWFLASAEYPGSYTTTTMKQMNGYHR